MTSSTAQAPAPAVSRTQGRVVAALVAAAALTGIAVAALPSMVVLLAPPGPRYCPAVLPPATSCVPGAHLVVVGGAAALLVLVWLVTDRALRGLAPRRGPAVAALAVTALLTWSAARVPQPYLLAWYGWS